MIVVDAALIACLCIDGDLTAQHVAAVAIEEGGDVTAFVHAGLKAVWADELNVEDSDTLRGRKRWRCGDPPNQALC